MNIIFFNINIELGCFIDKGGSNDQLNSTHTELLSTNMLTFFFIIFRELKVSYIITANDLSLVFLLLEKDKS